MNMNAYVRDQIIIDKITSNLEYLYEQQQLNIERRNVLVNDSIKLNKMIERHESYLKTLIGEE